MECADHVLAQHDGASPVCRSQPHRRRTGQRCPCGRRGPRHTARCRRCRPCSRACWGPAAGWGAKEALNSCGRGMVPGRASTCRSTSQPTCCWLRIDSSCASTSPASDSEPLIRPDRTQGLSSRPCGGRVQAAREVGGGWRAAAWPMKSSGLAGSAIGAGWTPECHTGALGLTCCGAGLLAAPALLPRTRCWRRWCRWGRPDAPKPLPGRRQLKLDILRGAVAGQRADSTQRRRDTQDGYRAATID